MPEEEGEILDRQKQQMFTTSRIELLVRPNKMGFVGVLARVGYISTCCGQLKKKSNYQLVTTELSYL